MHWQIQPLLANLVQALFGGQPLVINGVAQVRSGGDHSGALLSATAMHLLSHQFLVDFAKQKTPGPRHAQTREY